MKRISTNFHRKQFKIETSSDKFMFIGPIGKPRWPPWILICWGIFDFSAAAEQNSTKLNLKQDRNILYQVCVFRTNWKTKMAVLTSEWPRLFRILICSGWTEFNETWQEAWYQRHLGTEFVFIRQNGKPRWPPWSLIGRDFFDFSATVERNLTKLDRKQAIHIL